MDRLRIAQALSRHSAARGRQLPCFVEINIGAEDSKHGFLESDLPAALPALADLEGLDIQGLMAIPPKESGPAATRRWFAKLARLRDEISTTLGPGFPGFLSMGMSNDYELAIEEGATHVRVGTALFGPR